MWEHFGFIYEVFSNSDKFCVGKPSYGKFAKFLGVSVGKVQGWREAKQWPKAQDLKLLHNKLGLSYEWLVSGEGEPFAQKTVQEAAITSDPLLARLEAVEKMMVRNGASPQEVREALRVVMGMSMQGESKPESKPDTLALEKTA
ncbi:MAG: hypothetical protein R3Y11_00405 [Pseudomonadota bacterium]